MKHKGLLVLGLVALGVLLWKRVASATPSCLPTPGPGGAAPEYVDWLKCVPNGDFKQWGDYIVGEWWFPGYITLEQFLDMINNRALYPPK